MKETILLLLSFCLLGASRAIVSTRTARHEIFGQDLSEKRTRTPAQQKIDSQLLLAARLKRQGLATTGADVAYDSRGRAAVDISTEVTSKLLAAIRREGGEVVNSYPQFKTVRAYLTLESLETLASFSEVRVITRAAQSELSVNKSEAQASSDSPQRLDQAQQSVAVVKKASRTQGRRQRQRRHRNRHQR